MESDFRHLPSYIGARHSPVPDVLYIQCYRGFLFYRNNQIPSFFLENILEVKFSFLSLHLTQLAFIGNVVITFLEKDVYER